MVKKKATLTIPAQDQFVRETTFEADAEPIIQELQPSTKETLLAILESAPTFSTFFGDKKDPKREFTEHYAPFLAALKELSQRP